MFAKVFAIAVSLFGITYAGTVYNTGSGYSSSPENYLGNSYNAIGNGALGYNSIGYSGLGYNGLGYSGLGYSGLGYSGRGYNGLGSYGYNSWRPAFSALGRGYGGYSNKFIW